MLGLFGRAVGDEEVLAGLQCGLVADDGVVGNPDVCDRAALSAPVPAPIAPVDESHTGGGGSYKGGVLQQVTDGVNPGNELSTTESNSATPTQLI